MRKIAQGFVDFIGITLALGFLGWAYFSTDPASWEMAKALINGWQMPGQGLTALDWVTMAAVGLGLASTVYLLLKGGAILRGPVKVTLIR